MNQLVQTQAPSPDSQRGENLQSTDLNVLQEIQEEFGRRLGPAIAATLHCDVSASVKGICQQTYAEFHRGLTSPYVFPVAFPPEKGAAALNLSSGLIFPMLEVMMGGRSPSPTNVSRQLTAVEEDVLESLLQVVVRALTKSWKSVAEIQFNLLPQRSPNASLPLAQETVTIMSMNLEFGKDVSGSMNIALPAVLLRETQACAGVPRSAAGKAPSNERSELIFGLIQPAILEFEARLHASNVGLRDLLNLKEGQIVLLDNALDGTVDGLLNNTACYRGHVVSDGKQRCLRIEDFFESDTA